MNCSHAASVESQRTPVTGVHSAQLGDRGRPGAHVPISSPSPHPDEVAGLHSIFLPS